MTIWGVVNQKGGVGKTTTAVNFAAGLAARGLRTLLVDADPQGNATSGLGVEKSTIKLTLFDVFERVIDDPEGTPLPDESIIKVKENLHLIPATLDLAGAEPILLNAVGKELILRDALAKVEGEYDWIILDAPPSLGILTVNILAACDAVLVPMQCEFYALEGLSQLIKTIDVVKRRINPKLGIAKVVMTMYDPRNKLTQQVEEEVKQFFGDKVSSVKIPRNVRLSEAPGFGTPAVELFPDSKGAEAYMKFIEEVIG
ncbi:MAG: ParA family protein [Armatimonadetes bacterium]|nr:ParA family protein [Armatimonadota bacterium]